jgi:hypothetical protein
MLCKILRHIKNPYSIKDKLVGQIHVIFLQVCSCLATRCLLVTVMVAAYGDALYDATP